MSAEPINAACHCNDVLWHGLPCPVHGSHKAKPYKEGDDSVVVPKSLVHEYKLIKAMREDFRKLLAERDRLRTLNEKLVKALRSMQVAADEIAVEFIQHKRATNWGIVNKAYVETETLLRQDSE